MRRRSPSGETWEAEIVEERLPSGHGDTDAPKYVALSYVWGDPTINLELQEEDSVELNVSASKALGHLLLAS